MTGYIYIDIYILYAIILQYSTLLFNIHTYIYICAIILHCNLTSAGQQPSYPWHSRAEASRLTPNFQTRPYPKGV